MQMEKESNKEKHNPCKGKPKEEARLVNPEVSTLNCSETMTKIKSSKKQRKSEKVTSDQNADVEILNPSSVERDQIKSSVSNLMGALMVARKTIRKKYMKLHKQFEIHKFQRIVEIASADFISVVKRSNFPKSRRPLKASICAEIESILLQAKCNGIVNSIFSQQAPNMKEKLWLFVDQQFDFMFGKVREMFISCESISLELALEEKRENEKLNKKQKKNTVVKQFKDKFNKLPKLKGSPPSSRPSLTNNSSSKKNSGKNKPANLDKKLKGTPVLNKHSKKSAVCSANGIPKEEDPSTKGKHELSVNQVNSIDPPTNSNTVKDCHDKTELGILTEQQASTLTFNLLDAATWPPVTPNTHAVGLRPPLDLDILDESCMLEIPDKVMQTKDSAISPHEDSNSQKIIESSSVQQARSSVSSILVEDLAIRCRPPGSKSTRQSSPVAAEENLGFELEPNNDLGTETVHFVYNHKALVSGRNPCCRMADVKEDGR
eukprot:g38379.t1